MFTHRQAGLNFHSDNYIDCHLGFRAFLVYWAINFSRNALLAWLYVSATEHIEISMYVFWNDNFINVWYKNVVNNNVAFNTNPCNIPFIQHKPKLGVDLCIHLKTKSGDYSNFFTSCVQLSLCIYIHILINVCARTCADKRTRCSKLYLRWPHMIYFAVFLPSYIWSSLAVVNHRLLTYTSIHLCINTYMG